MGKCEYLFMSRPGPRAVSRNEVTENGNQETISERRKTGTKKRFPETESRKRSSVEVNMSSQFFVSGCQRVCHPRYDHAGTRELQTADSVDSKQTTICSMPRGDDNALLPRPVNSRQDAGNGAQGFATSWLRARTELSLVRHQLWGRRSRTSPSLEAAL